MVRIYCDHHTTSKMDPEVIQVLQEHYENSWGLYTQPQEEGQKLVDPIQKAFGAILSFINADENYTPVFVSGAAEANNHVYHHYYHSVVKETGRNHVITLSSEDATILLPLKNLEDLGVHTTWLPVGESGAINVDAIIKAITPRTGLISFSLAGGLTGVLQDLEGLKEICEQRKILLHLDVSYAIGKVLLDIQALGADFVTFGGDLIHGPKSSGLLVCKDSCALKPMIIGGLEQAGLRAGPFDAALFLGFAKACELAEQSLEDMGLEVTRLRNLFEKKLTEQIEGVQVLFKSSKRLPNTSVCSFERVHCDHLLYALNKRGVSASLGGGAFQKLSLLLENMGFSLIEAHSSLSFAFSREVTKEQINMLVGILADEVNRLRLQNQELKSVYET